MFIDEEKPYSIQSSVPKYKKSFKIIYNSVHNFAFAKLAKSAQLQWQARRVVSARVKIIRNALSSGGGSREFGVSAVKEDLWCTPAHTPHMHFICVCTRNLYGVPHAACL